MGESCSPATPPCGTGLLFFDFKDRLSSAPVEGEEHAHLGGLYDRRHHTVATPQFDQRWLRRQVVVPHVVVHELPIPHQCSGGCPQRHEGVRVAVVANAFAAIEVRARRARRYIDQTQLGVRGQRRPRIRGTRSARLLDLPVRRGGIVRGTRDRIPAPALSARSDVDAANDAQFEFRTPRLSPIAEPSTITSSTMTGGEVIW